MEKILLIGIVLASLFSAGAVGTVMSRYDMGMMQGYYRGMGSGGCPMMNVEEIQGLQEGNDEYIEDYCTDLTYEECEEMHEECEEHMYKYCEHDDTIEDSKRRGYGCPMMR